MSERAVSVVSRAHSRLAREKPSSCRLNDHGIALPVGLDGSIGGLAVCTQEACPDPGLEAGFAELIAERAGQVRLGGRIDDPDMLLGQLAVIRRHRAEVESEASGLLPGLGQLWQESDSCVIDGAGLAVDRVAGLGLAERFEEEDDAKRVLVHVTLPAGVDECENVVRAPVRKVGRVEEVDEPNAVRERVFMLKDGIPRELDVERLRRE